MSKIVKELYYNFFKENWQLPTNFGRQSSHSHYYGGSISV